MSNVNNKDTSHVKNLLKIHNFICFLWFNFMLFLLTYAFFTAKIMLQMLLGARWESQEVRLKAKFPN